MGRRGRRLLAAGLVGAALVLGAGRAVAAAEPPGQGCVSARCHADFARLRKPHDPVAKGQCSSCHPSRSGRSHPSQEDPAADFLPPRGASACRECHAKTAPFHAVAEDKKQDPCLRCHEPHGGDRPALLRGSEAELCASCHAKTLNPPHSRRMPPRAKAGPKPPAAPGGEKVYRHGPFAKGRCAPCHPAHDASARHMLAGSFPESSYTRYRRSRYSACLGRCHSPRLVEAKRTITATKFRNGDDNLHYRHVARQRRGRSCRLCHDPHQALNRALVRDGMPYGNEMLTLKFEPTEKGGKCTTTCHIPSEYSRAQAIPSPMRVP